MTISNISRATKPIVTKFHIEPKWVEETKMCSDHTGHIISMAAMPSPHDPLVIYVLARFARSN